MGIGVDFGAEEKDCTLDRDWGVEVGTCWGVEVDEAIVDKVDTEIGVNVYED